MELINSVKIANYLFLMYLKNNNKFWSIDSDDSKVIIRFGKLSENDEEVGV